MTDASTSTMTTTIFLRVHQLEEESKEERSKSEEERAQNCKLDE